MNAKLIVDGKEFDIEILDPELKELVAKSTHNSMHDRADKLMRQLRRFSIEHRKKELNWDSMYSYKWAIIWSYVEKDPLTVCPYTNYQFLFTPYFDSKQAAELAIDTFRDELTWYFTEYKNSL